MERLDRARRIGGLAWVAAGLIFGIGSAALIGVVPGVITVVLAVAVVALAAVVLTRPTSPRGVLASWSGGWVVAVLLAADFAGAVADRFGAFGRPGTTGVSWGSWSAFVDYTRTLLHQPPEALAVVAAAGATAAEATLAVVLLTGWQRRWAGKAAAGLLTFYLLAMAASVGFGDVARYALPLQIGGALLVTVCPVARPRAVPKPQKNSVKIHG
jgi:hypothetical protein